MNKKLKSRRKSMKKSRTKIRAGVYNELRKKLIDNGVPEIMVDKIIRDALLKHPVIKMFEDETNRKYQNLKKQLEVDLFSAIIHNYLKL